MMQGVELSPTESSPVQLSSAIGGFSFLENLPRDTPRWSGEGSGEELCLNPSHHDI
jgi:hypothetical protein